MYAKSVIAKRLEKVERVLGFEPEYHSVKTVARANDHFRLLLDPDTGRTKRKLKKDEIRWVRNERAICQVDFNYWSTRYAFIRDNEARLIRFAPNVAQRIQFDIWAELEELGRAISIQNLKARQLGISTGSELAVAHRAQFYSHVNAVVSSSDPEKSEEMAGMMERCWANQPWFLMPVVTKHQAGEMIEFGRQDSAVSIQHGTQFSGIARGTTPTVAHLSEICDYKNPEELIDASLLKAMHESPWMLLILESTAKGRHNWWHETWEISKEGWANGTARFRPVFLPWFVGRDIYPTETWLRTRPIPQGWKPAERTSDHARRAAEYVESNELLRKHLGQGWQMPPEQMWFWEVQRAEHVRKKTLSKFYAEMPADDTEAFQSTAISVFDAEVISMHRERTHSPKAVFGIIGDDIPERMRPPRREWDDRFEPVNITSVLPNGQRFRAQMVPLKFTGYSGWDWINKLMVWEFPQEHNDYGIGIDTGDGVGKDRTVIEVLRKGSVDCNDHQAAEWASPYVGAYDLSPVAFTIGRMYTQWREREIVEPKMVIEVNRNGEIVQLELRKMGWKHFHTWLRYDNKRMKQSQSQKLGWMTNAWSRPMMMDFLVKSIRDEWFEINSPYFVDEMSDLEATADRQSLRAAYGGHDDRLMGGGICLFSLHVLDLRGTQRSLMRMRPVDRDEANNYPSYRPPDYAHDVDENHPLSSYAMMPEQEPLEEESETPPWHKR